MGELKVKAIYEDLFTKWLDSPTLSDSKMVVYITSTYGVSRRSAYKYLADVKSVLGNVRNAGREWHRYVCISMIQDAYERAKEQDDLGKMLSAIALYGRYTQLDKSEAQAVDWEKFIPPSFEPTADVALLDLDKVRDLRALRRKLEKKFGVMPVNRREEFAAIEAQLVTEDNEGEQE